MHLWKVTLTHVGIFSRIPVGTTIYVKSERTDKPDCDDVKQAFIDKFGTYPTGTVSWYYTDEF